MVIELITYYDYRYKSSQTLHRLLEDVSSLIIIYFYFVPFGFSNCNLHVFFNQLFQQLNILELVFQSKSPLII